ncbi:MAG TPA: hypothetical protein VI365_02365 [Trebonia sp.]
MAVTAGVVGVGDGDVAEIAVVGCEFPASRWDSVLEAAQPAQQMARIVNPIVVALVFHPMPADTRRVTWECP